MPGQLRTNLLEWRQHHPDWTFVLWNDASLFWLKHRDLYDRASEIVPADAVWQFRADIARYEILNIHGGLYVDCDTFPLQSLDVALEGHDAWAAWEDRNWIGNSVLYSVAHHPVMERLVADLRRNVAQDALHEWRPNRLSGPRYLTPIWREFGCYVAPRRRVYPYGYADVKQGTVPTAFGPDVLCVHQWHHTRQIMEARHARPREPVRP